MNDAMCWTLTGKRKKMTKHKSSDERQEQILTAARKCFIKKGYFATKVDDIAQEAGLSKGGIYFHFESKREIFRSLVQQEYDAATAFIDHVVDSEHDIMNMLEMIGDHFVEKFSEDSDMPRFMAIIGEMSLRDSAIQTMLVELQQSYIDRIAFILEKAMDLGQLRRVNPRSAALMLKVMLDGFQASFAIGYKPATEMLLPDVMDILAQGLLPQSSAT